MAKILLLIVNVLLMLVFAAFAWLQRDDADTSGKYENPWIGDVWVWITFYGLVSAGFLLALFRKHPWPLYLVLVAFCAWQFARTGHGLITNFSTGNPTLTGEAMSAAKPFIEQSREFFGALIALTAVGFLWLQGRRARRRKS